MANEALLLIELEPPIPFTVTNATGIPKGTICALSDPWTAAGSSATADIVAGISATEKIASDGEITLGIFRRGIFRVKASGSIAVGDPVGTAGLGTIDNYVYSLRAVVGNTVSGSRTLGIALEAAADDETFAMELNIQTIHDM